MDILKEQGHARLCPVVVIMRGERILMGLRHYTAEKWKEISVWTLPGGRCDPGESVEETLRREVKEETGITDLKLTGTFGDVPGAYEGDTVRVFTGQTEQEPELREPEKFSEWKWMPLDKVPENFINPAALDLIRKSVLV